MCTINNYPFTNKQNTIGFIYLVRDPRDVILSYSHHLKKSIEYAHANEDKALEYALSYGRGISKENGRKFVRMYVNADTVNMGKEGEAALKRLFSLAFDKGIIDSIPELDFIRV